jgi:prevent-host-death family protein
VEKYSVGEAKSRFSELISRASAGERFLIERREHPVAVILSPAEYERMQRTVSTARRLALALGQDQALLEEIEAGRVHPAMAAFGLWDSEELDEIAAELEANRARQRGRTEVDL